MCTRKVPAELGCKIRGLAPHQVDQDVFDLVGLFFRDGLGTGEDIGGVLLVGQQLGFLAGGPLRERVTVAPRTRRANSCDPTASACMEDEQARPRPAGNGKAPVQRHEHVGGTRHVHVVAALHRQAWCANAGATDSTTSFSSTSPLAAPGIDPAMPSIDDDHRLGMPPGTDRVVLVVARASLDLGAGGGSLVTKLARIGRDQVRC
jgi:hypothetical protein